jgi:biotin transport system substrate-specific component
MILGNLVIYGVGVPVLAWVLGVSLAQGVMLGVMPFLAGDLAKIALAVAVLPSVWKLAGRHLR